AAARGDARSRDVRRGQAAGRDRGETATYQHQCTALQRAGGRGEPAGPMPQRRHGLMNQPGWLSLIVLREALNATTRLLRILMRSRPTEGFPLLRLFLDVLERISLDAHAETVAPALSDFLDRCEVRCP